MGDVGFLLGDMCGHIQCLISQNDISRFSFRYLDELIVAVRILRMPISHQFSQLVHQ